MTVGLLGILRVDVAMALTGRFWFKKTWSGKLILLVEEQKPRWFRRGETKLRWREARLLDLAEMPLRPLMDLGRVRGPGRAAYDLPSLRIVETPKSLTAS